MSQWLDRRQPWGWLALGLSMTVHGYERIVPHGALHHFAHFAATVGIPRSFAIVSAYTEFVGGILLLMGLLTRLAAALVAVNMLVALFTLGIHRGFGVYDSVFALAAMAIMLVFSGAGAMSVDRKIGFS